MLRLSILFAIAVVTAVVAQEPAFDAFAEGREAYVKRCLPCHQRKRIEYEPSSYSQRGLWDMVNRMAPLSKLDYYQQMAVQSYLEAVRTGGAKLPGGSRSPTNKPPAAVATTSKNEFAAAQELYLAKCASCHAHKVEPINPGKHSEAKLKGWMQRMGPIAKFTPAQTDLVGRYLEAVRTGKATLPGAPMAKQK